MELARAWGRCVSRPCLVAVGFQLSKTKGVLNVGGGMYFVSLNSTLKNG